ncbi:MAG: efflux RND transporter periplasmic adaptor subunit [Spirochaetales bacterium]|jgi:HlyD family secretion protein|nr:efflux RND transporter periplasmic adaptor subunit [Spirochaetales bacterium]
MSGGRKKIFVCGVMLLCVAGGFVFLGGKTGSVVAGYETAGVGRGTIEETVSSSGKLQAVGTVNVLTQLTGTVERVLVDFNDEVRKGQPLVELNTEMLKISLREAEASLAKARAQYEHSRLLFTNNQSLFERKLLSGFDLDTSKTDMEVLRAALIQAETQYEKARLNIDEYAIILSPIDGIVLDRKVEKGETVVANSGSVTQLFILAENLNTMEIKGDVDELDISSIRLGMDVRFTVEAYPERNFTGVVGQIRKVPVETDNVVNYTVIVTTENPDGILLPGMTANMEFLVMEKKDVLMVPAAAFRFSPPEDIAVAARRKLLEQRLADRPAQERQAALKQFDEEARAASRLADGQRPGGGFFSMPRFGGGGRANQQNASVRQGSAGAARRPLWFLDGDGSLSLRMVRTGVVDSLNIELLEAEDLEGLSVVIRQK